MSLRSQVARHLSPQMRAKVRSAIRLVSEPGFDYTTSRHFRLLIKEFAIDLIVDVGANTGQFGRMMRETVGYNGDMISLEPVSSTFQRLEQTARDDKRWKCFQKAAGARAEKLSINVTNSSVFDSFRQQDTTELFTDVAIVRKEEVEVVRMDEFLATHSAKNIFLKVDTQGFDLEVFRGATGILSKVRAIQTELSFIPIYHDSAPYQAVIDELSGLGFAISNMSPIGMSNMQAVEFDCLMVKKAPRSNGMSYENMIKGAPKSLS